ncbi:UPF0223 family protein [Planococcus sp. ISL-109]|uniref:UPF0223 family protein n=1 Tax=Planococcus sp. ISL-109 TaxID=2819166 RepID=UPI001BEBDD5D|nr:UPF0223 family protein [Planococcus sp. ISL-109]MBT2581810.1 UPF0223 family protein [Planococcus sp. ISL-109]
MDYSYPFSIDWTTDEIVDVVEFFQAIEDAYEKGIKREELMDKYRKFKKVVPSMAEEKNYFREFEEESSYVSYAVIKRMKEASGDELIRIKKS